MPDNFSISTDRSRLDLSTIVDFLSHRSYWAKGRSATTIEKSLSNSLCFGVFSGEDKQVGFARVVSDFAVFAWIMDVFILKEFRRQGLSELLMKTIMTHPDLQGLSRWGLVTHDAHRLYEKFGFKPIAQPDLMMEVINQTSG